MFAFLDENQEGRKLSAALAHKIFLFLLPSLDFLKYIYIAG